MRLLLVAVLCLHSVAHAYELTRDSSGESAHWKAPLRFVIADSLATGLRTEGSEQAVRAALKTFNEAVPSLQLSAVSGKTHGVGYDFDNPSASTSDVLAPDDWKWNVNAVATTVITISRATHQIIEADIAFNSKHTDFAVVGRDARGSHYDIQNAMTHELGHALGLAHTSVPDAVMFPSSHPGEVSKRKLAADDLEGLRFLYAQPAAVAVAEEPAPGCSATGSAPFALVALMMGAWVRRRRVFVALAIVLGAVVFVGPVFASTAAADVAWTVSAVTTLPPGAGAVVLESNVTFVRDGVTHTVRVPGGRWGELEQVVEGFFVPRVGERLFQVTR